MPEINTREIRRFLPNEYQRLRFFTMEDPTAVSRADVVYDPRGALSGVVMEVIKGRPLVRIRWFKTEVDEYETWQTFADLLDFYYADPVMQDGALDDVVPLNCPCGGCIRIQLCSEE